VNYGAFSNSCNLQVMRHMLCHLTIMNGDAHILVHKKSLKGFVNDNKDHSTSFLKKTCFRVTLNKIYKVGVVGANDKS
jgi:hypothetical protein